MYEFDDQSWRQRPRLMSADTVDVVVERICEHVCAHELDAVTVVLHGGEPLLVGPDHLGRTVKVLRAVESTGARLDLNVQTNGLLLDETFLEIFHEFDVKVGVSLDGTAAAHDRRRRGPDGRPSHDQVREALALLAEPRHRPLFSGLLGVIDLAEDPIAYYEAMIEFAPPQIDLRLPHGTWSVPPPGKLPSSTATPYGDWLVSAFDRWYLAPRRETRVRFFESIIRLLIGGRTRSESLGLAPVDIVTIETDGSIEQVDTLKVAAPGAAMTGFHVTTHSFDEALEHPGIVARQRGLAALSTACQSCPVVSVCGGGLYTHRHRKGHGFENPSVYCHDLYRLIMHVWGRVQASIDALRASGAAGAGVLEDEVPTVLR